MTDYHDWETTKRLEKKGFKVERGQTLRFEIWDKNILVAIVRSGQGLHQFLTTLDKDK